MHEESTSYVPSGSGSSATLPETFLSGGFTFVFAVEKEDGSYMR